MVVITQADHEELMENDEVSAEAAGAVRGVARTMQLFVRRAAVGRVPVRRVAKLSDVASNAVDMLSNASETFASSTSNGASKAGNVSGQRTRYFRIEFLSLMRKTGVLAGG